MQPTPSPTMQAIRITGTRRRVDANDEPRRALGIVDGLLSVTQQEWALGVVVKQPSEYPKVMQ